MKTQAEAMACFCPFDRLPCGAAHCMAWRWEGPGEVSEERRGYCGMVERPEVVMVARTQSKPFIPLADRRSGQ